MNLDTRALLHARQETMISASPDRVWSVLTNIDHWPEWQPDVSSARLDGKLGVGTRFHWKAKGMGIASTIRELQPGRLIGWSGDSLGMHAAHMWTLEPQAHGTRVITEESLSGWIPLLLRVFDPAFLQKSLMNSLRDLKHRSEQQ